MPLALEVLAMVVSEVPALEVRVAEAVEVPAQVWMALIIERGYSLD